MKVSIRLTVILLLAVLLPVLVVTYINLSSTQKVMTKIITQNLETNVRQRIKNANEYSEHLVHGLLTLSQNKFLIDVLDSGKVDYLDAFYEYTMNEHKFYDMFLIDKDSKIIFSVKRESDFHKNLNKAPLKGSKFSQAYNEAIHTKKPAISNFTFYKPSNEYAAFIVVPIFENDKVKGAIAAQLSIYEFLEFSENYAGLGDSVEVSLAQMYDDKRIVVINKLRKNPNSMFKKYITIGSPYSIPMQKAIKGEFGSGIYDDYQHVETIASWGYIKSFKIGIVVRINAQEAYAQIRYLKNLSLLMAIVIFFVLVYVIYHIQKMVFALESVKDRYDFAIKGTNDGLWDWDLVANTIYFSSRIKTMLGYDEDEDITLQRWEKELVHPDDLENTLEKIKKCHKNPDEVYRATYRVKRKDGTYIWILDRGQTVFENNKAVRMIGFHTDINKRKLLELELIEKDNLLQEAQKLSKLGSWKYSFSEDKLTWSDEIYSIFEKDKDEFTPSYESFLDAIHPDDREMVSEAYKKSLIDKKPYEVVHRFIAKDGSTKYLFERCETEYDDEGRPKISMGTVQDITQIKVQKIKIHELSRFLSNTINSLANFVFVKDSNFKYIECNKAFEGFVGLSRDEIIGKSDFDLFDEESAKFFRQKDEEMLKSGIIKNNYEWVTYPDGREVYLFTSKSPLLAEDGKIIGLVGNSIDMTENKKLQDKLDESRYQFEQFMSYIPAHIFMIEDETIIYANDLAQIMISNVDDGIVGKKVEDVFPKKLSDEVKNFEPNKAEGIITIDIDNKNKIYRNLSFEIKTLDGKRIGLVLIDITKEYKAKKEITRVLSAFERSNISVVMTDIDANIEYVNPSWCELTGYSKEELIGQNPRIVKSGYVSDETYKKMWEELTNGRVWNSEIKNKAKDGSEFWEESTIIPSFDKDGNINGYISFKLEINEKMRLKQELRDKEEIMIAQSRHAAMGEMISMIAHQWRQPISVIAMDVNNILADIELEDVKISELKDETLDILNQTKYLSQTIDDFRNFFKPNKLKDEVLVSDVFKEALLVIDKSLQHAKIEVINSYSTDTKVLIYSRELLQVFLNILKNAKESLVEHRSEGRVIRNDIYEDDEYVIVEISDNGTIIDEKISNKMFEPYFSTKEAKNGTGLGLYISKIIIEKHLAGHIEALSKDGGTSFVIKIPKQSIQKDTR
jgi:PAS domain S-box-containing protein